MGYSDVEDYGPILKVIAISFLIPTSLLFFWRITSKFTRHNQLGGFGIEDIMLILAMILAWFFATVVLLSVEKGFGRPGAKLQLAQKKRALLFFWLAQIDYKFQVMFSKLTVLFFYRKVFSTDSVFEKFTRYFMALIVAASVAFGVANVFQCWPVKRAWNRALPGTCFNNEIYWISHAVFHVSTDMIIFFMPIWPISKLNMMKSRKVAVICAFALGSIVCIADCVRIYFLKVSAGSKDPTYGAGMAVIMTVIVQYLSIICICLVTGLRKSIISCFQRIRGNNQTKQSHYQLSDIQSNNHTSGENWIRSQNRVMVGRTVSEEHIIDPELDGDSSSERGKSDIVVKTTFDMTVTSTTRQG